MSPRPLSTATAALALLSLAQTATAYDWEVDLAILDSEEQPSPQFEGTISYFFAPLNHGTSAPWSELEFTDRISKLKLGTEYSSQDTSFWNTYELSTVNRSYALGYTKRQATSPHVFSAALGYRNIKTTIPQFSWIVFPSPYQPFGSEEVSYTTFKTKAYSYGLGYSYYLGENWTVGASVSLDELPMADLISTTLSTNRLWDLGKQRWAGINVSVQNLNSKTIGESHDSLNLKVEGRYYFSEKTGISLQVEFPEDSVVQHQATLGLNHFLTDSAFIKLGYQYVDLDYPIYSLGPNGKTPPSSDSAIQAKLGLRF